MRKASCVVTLSPRLALLCWSQGSLGILASPFAAGPGLGSPLTAAYAASATAGRATPSPPPPCDPVCFVSVGLSTMTVSSTLTCLQMAHCHLYAAACAVSTHLSFHFLSLFSRCGSPSRVSLKRISVRERLRIGVLSCHACS